MRARAYFDLKRWLPSRLSWWVEHGPSMETPTSLSYIAVRLTDPDNMAWTFVFDEFSSFLTAAWVEWLTVNGLFCWLPEEVLTWLDALDLSRLADGSGGAARLATLRNMRAAHAELPWGTVVANVRRRDYRSKVARQVYVKLDNSAKYDFVSRHPCGSFDWKRDPSWSMPVEVGVGGRGPVAEFRGGRRGPRSLSCSRSPIRRVGDRAGSSGVPAVATGSSGYEPEWPSEFAPSGAVALLGSDRAAQLSDPVVPRGETAGALAIAWSRQVFLLRDSLRSVDGKTEFEAIATLIRKVSDLTLADTMRDTFVSELQDAPELAVREPSPCRV